MKNNIRFMITIFLSIMVLVACGTAEQPLSEQDNNSATTNNNTDNVQKEEQETDNEEQEQPTSTNEDNTSITFTSNGKEFTEKISPISGKTYTLQAIPGFALTAEEPGKDMLYYEKDDSVSMRIEVISNNESFSDLVANTEETMAAIDQQYETFDLTPYVSKADLENSAAYIANFDNEEVITVVFEKNDKFVRLTIYDNEASDLSDAMIKMGLTIE